MAAMFTSALLLPLNSFFDLPTTRHKCAQTHIESQLSTVYGFPITSFRIEWSRHICIQDAQCTIKLYQRFKSNHSSLAGLCHLCLFLSYPFRLFLFRLFLFHPYLTIVDLISQDCWLVEGRNASPSLGSCASTTYSRAKLRHAQSLRIDKQHMEKSQN